MRVEIIAVGTELLMGQIANTNAQFLARKLNELGFDHYVQTVIGDNPERLKKVTAQAEKRADIIIYTGGLGPTRDDLTKQTISEYLNQPLTYDEVGMETIKATFKGRVMTENNLAMGLTFEAGHTFPNDVGQALGTAIEHQDHTYILLPGPPSEMKYMFDHYVADYLLDQYQNDVVLNSKYLHYFGIGESQLADTIDDLIMAQDNPTVAIYFGNFMVTVRLTAAGNKLADTKPLLDELAKAINDRLADYYVGEGENLGINEVLVDKLTEDQQTITFAESFTGGLAAKKVVDVSGASKVLQGSAVTYTEAAKAQVLNVQKETLENFGMVSAETAIEMAEKVRDLYQSDFGVSFTGVAGPDDMEGKEVGTVYIGIAQPGQETKVLTPAVRGSRQNIQYRSVYAAYFDIIKNK
ncbi:competence/damage-inducible protein A [Aerococcaceae bacterium 50-4]